jgi:hypothetical protein
MAESDKFTIKEKDKNDTSFKSILKAFVESALQAKDDTAWFKLAKLLQTDQRQHGSTLIQITPH